MAKKKSVKNHGQSQQPGDQPNFRAVPAVKGLVAAKPRCTPDTSSEKLRLNESEQATVAALLALPASLKEKLEKKDAGFTLTEIEIIARALPDAFRNATPQQHEALQPVATTLMNFLQTALARMGKPAATRRTKATQSADTLYLFKITLVGIKPAIWRRIQVPNCTLDELHEFIQASMGWTNSHLHHFKIGEQFYGNPILMEQVMGEMEYEDSTRTMLSEVLPTAARRFRFVYEYDFGDNWEHEILFEGYPKDEPGHQHPICLEGERACPPDDCGGVWGYKDFLKAIGDKKQIDHESMLEWVGGAFDPEAFDAAKATQAMRMGLPDSRHMD